MSGTVLSTVSHEPKPHSFSRQTPSSLYQIQWINGEDALVIKGGDPLLCLERIRDYYLKLGIVTTAAPCQPGAEHQRPGAPYIDAVKFSDVYFALPDEFPGLHISHIAIDRHDTTAEDRGIYIPLIAFRKFKQAGQVGSISTKFYGLATNRSQHKTRDNDYINLLGRCKQDDFDVTVLKLVNLRAACIL